MKRKVITKKRSILIIVIILLVGIVAWLVMWMLQPSKGTVTLHSTSNSSQTSPTYTSKILDGTYLTFSYSSKYTVKNEGAKNNDLEVYRLSADTHYNKQILASVSNLPDGKLTSDSAYIYRKLHTDLYTPRVIQVANLSVDVWVKNDGTEQTVMIPHGDKVATFAFLTASSIDNLSQEVDALLSTFRWK